jgi:hypothetical protein
MVDIIEWLTGDACHALDDAGLLAALHADPSQASGEVGWLRRHPAFGLPSQEA